MIAKYNGKCFNISLIKKPTRIWRYDAVDEFQKKVNPDGLVVYEKYLELHEIDQIFDVGFSVCWDGKWCGVFYSEENDLISLKTDDPDFAITHGMTLLERGVYSCARSAAEFTEYRMYTQDLDAKDKIYTMVSYEDFKILWKQMVADLIPPRG